MEKYTPDYSRITESVDTNLMKSSHVVLVGAGGLATLAKNLARLGIGKLTVIDFDIIEAVNLTRQDFVITDIGKYKVDALKEAVKHINPHTEFVGHLKKVQELTETEKENVFGSAHLIVAGTDSFKAQAYINLLAIEHNVPAIWAGWYKKSRTAELFFQIPEITPACFRCATSSRYLVNEKQEIKVSSNCNTIFHSQLLDSFIGLIATAILHRNRFEKIGLGGDLPEYSQNENESFRFIDAMKMDGIIHYNFFQFKVHPNGGNKLFKNLLGHIPKSAFNFMSHWQRIEPELKRKGYDYNCPDCQGKLYKMTQASRN